MEALNLDSSMSSIVLHDSDEELSHLVRDAYEYYTADNISQALSVLLNNPLLHKYSYVHVLLGNCYRKNNNIEKAVTSWFKALELNPREFSAYLNMGNVYYANNEPAKAVDNWMSAYAIQPENPTVNLNLAVAYNEKGSRISATKYFEQYLVYAPESMTKEYISVKETMTRLRGKVDFYFRRLRELKEEGNLRAIVSLYVKLISTYAYLPTVYMNLANIFLFDKNTEKALEFFLIIFKYFEHTNQVVWNIATLYDVLGKKSYAYCYYKRCESFIGKSHSKYKIIIAKLDKLVYSVKNEECYEEHVQKAKAAEAANLYEEALAEYENSLYLSPEERPDIQQKAEKIKILLNPIPTVIAELYQEVNDAMNTQKFNRCIELCDRIIMLSDLSSKEGKFAVRCKTECKRLLMTQDRRGFNKNN